MNMSNAPHVPVPIASSAEVSPSPICVISTQTESIGVSLKENSDGRHTSYSEMMKKSEKYQEESENMSQVVTSIESDIEQVRALHEQAPTSTYENIAEPHNLKELYESTTDKLVQIRARLVALGEENISFKESHPEHTSMLGYRVHVHWSFSHRFASVIQEWKDINDMLKNDAKGHVDEQVEKLLLNFSEGEDGVQDGDKLLLSQARARMKDVKEIEDRLDLIHQMDSDVKKILEAHWDADESDNPEIKETQAKLDIPHVEEPESAHKRTRSRMRISWAAVPVVIIIAALVLGLLTRFKPKWYERNIRETPKSTASFGIDPEKQNMIPVDLVQLFEANRILQI